MSNVSNDRPENVQKTSLALTFERRANYHSPLPAGVVPVIRKSIEIQKDWSMGVLKDYELVENFTYSTAN